MRKAVVMGALCVAVLSHAAPSAQQKRGAPASRQPALLQDYVTFTVTGPPAQLELDPFYKKYVDAQGIPVVSSEKVPDPALLVPRDIVQFMLSDRADLRKELIRKKWKVAIMAETERTYDIPEHRKFRLLPTIDDERLTPQQRVSYNSPGGVGTMTGEQYWNATTSTNTGPAAWSTTPSPTSTRDKHSSKPIRACMSWSGR